MDPLTIIAIGDAVIRLGSQVASVIRQFRDQQAKELTEEQRAALDARIHALEALPHWQIAGSEKATTDFNV